MTDLKTLNAALRTNSFLKGFHLTKADATQFEALFGANEKVVGWLARIAKCPAFDPFAAPAGDDDFELFEDSAPADGAAAAAAKLAPKKAAAKKDDDEEDFDLFGDTTEEEQQAVADRAKAEAAARLVAKQKAGKSSLVIDIKPWDDETKMDELEGHVRSIEMEGLAWGASKLVEVAFGVKKLQIMLTVHDDLVSVEELEEKLLAFEDHIQSMDIVVFNKI